MGRLVIGTRAVSPSLWAASPELELGFRTCWGQKKIPAHNMEHIYIYIYPIGSMVLEYLPTLGLFGKLHLGVNVGKYSSSMDPLGIYIIGQLKIYEHIIIIIMIIIIIIIIYIYIYIYINGLTPWCRRPLFKGGGRSAQTYSHSRNPANG